MSEPASTLPPPFNELGERPFSFYPPILNVSHNYWRCKEGTWSEVLVVNEKAGLEVWVPRRFLGKVSSVDEPVVIVGLTKELEYKAGSLWPHERRVLEMPSAGIEALPHFNEPAPQPPSALKFRNTPESRIGLLIGACLLVALLVYVAIVAINRETPLRTRVAYSVRDQSFLELHANDDYFAVVRKLGRPVRDRWLSEGGEIQFRALSYPDRGYTVILMGEKRESAQYIGALNDEWKPVHAVDIGKDANTAAMLRSLRRF